MELSCRQITVAKINLSLVKSKMDLILESIDDLYLTINSLKALEAFLLKEKGLAKEAPILSGF